MSIETSLREWGNERANVGIAFARCATEHQGHDRYQCPELHEAWERANDIIRELGPAFASLICEQRKRASKTP